MSHTADWMLVFICAPEKEPEPAGVLLLDRASNQLSVKLKPTSLLAQTDESILEIWEYLTADLDSKAKAYGGAEVLAWLESKASHTFRVSDKKLLFEAADLRTALQQLYMEHVEQ
jgi:hypothetical protein